MSETEVPQEQAVVEPPFERPNAPPIESRFLFVDVAALRAKQLRRGAKVRLDQPGDESQPGPRPMKPERAAMEEVRRGYVEWSLPDFKAVFDTR
ncbi:MAG: DNA-directed RNA polymerase subunit omega [Acidobacteriota bacterium]